MKKRHAHKTNILLVNITRLGDMLQATPTIAGMKAENPGAKVTVLVEKQFEDVCHYLPHIDEVVSVDLGMTCRSLAREQDGIIDAYEYVGEFVDDLRRRKFDYCLNMSSSAYTALLLNLIGIDRNGGWTADDEGYRVIESDWARLFATSVFHQNRQFNSLNLVDVFRCSADIENHPHKLLINVGDPAKAHAEELIRAAKFTNTGPIIAVQAGASQEKRQWATEHFVKLVRILVDKLNARVLMIGAKKELPIVEPIAQAVNSPNVAVIAGKTSIPELAGVLELADLLVTGDTGPMHMAVAAGTPVVAMFLASAYGFETGPYSPDNIVLQPVIGCGPCNPNKPCARPDCHDQISPELVAEMVRRRLDGPVTSIPGDLADPQRVIVYRSTFDRFGFCDLEALNSNAFDPWAPYRAAYRKLWLTDLAGYSEAEVLGEVRRPGSLAQAKSIEGLDSVVALAQEGAQHIKRLVSLIKDPYGSSKDMGTTTSALAEIDRKIEEVGFRYPPLGPATRMFVFGKENLSGSEALGLASQMGGVYESLINRTTKLNQFLQVE